MSTLERLEKKYLIDEPTAARIAAAIAPYCTEDTHGAGGYTIHSVYWDTLDLAFYQLNATKQSHRKKPRVRYYGLEATGPLFLELKRKDQDVVVKTRREIPNARWPAILDEPVQNDDGFLPTVHLYGAQPTVHVRYEREAYISDLDTYARVTFDRNLRCAPAYDPSLAINDDELIYFDDPRTFFAPGSFVVLELKCLDLIPHWMAELAARFDLNQVGFSKYCGAVERIGLRG